MSDAIVLDVCPRCAQITEFPVNRFVLPGVLAVGLAVVVGCESIPLEARPIRPGPTADEIRFAMEIRIRESDPAKATLWVTASDPSVWPQIPAASATDFWEPILSLRLAPASVAAGKTPTLPLLGEYSVTGNRLEFQPKYPLLPGEKYQARFDPTRWPGLAVRGMAPIVREYQLASKKPAAPPIVTGIYPSGSEVPANHLKFYLVFSEPMQTGDNFKYFKLLDAHGLEVPEPFRETELWSMDGRRLTLWFHPGRQKTGVNLNVEIGPVLVAGHSYTLVIAGDWPSQRGVPLGRAIEKPFHAGPADHTQPDARVWKLESPPASTRGKLRLTFPKAHDWALLQSQLWVETAAGKRVPGQIEIGTGELSWNFEPASAWPPGNYRLAMGSVLEDLAGNSLARPFEVDVAGPAAKPVAPVIYRPFILRH